MKNKTEIYLLSCLAGFYFIILCMSIAIIFSLIVTAMINLINYNFVLIFGLSIGVLFEIGVILFLSAKINNTQESKGGAKNGRT